MCMWNKSSEDVLGPKPLSHSWKEKHNKCLSELIDYPLSPWGPSRESYDRRHWKHWKEFHTEAVHHQNDPPRILMELNKKHTNKINPDPYIHSYNYKNTFMLIAWNYSQLSVSNKLIIGRQIWYLIYFHISAWHATYTWDHHLYFPPPYCAKYFFFPFLINTAILWPPLYSP